MEELAHLRPEDCALLVVDIQEKLMPVISGREGVVRNSTLLMKAARVMEVPILATTQYAARIGDLLPEVIAGLDGVTLADQGVEQCAIVTFYTAQLPADKLQQQLALRLINTSSVPFSANPVSSEKLHHPALLRASPHYYNTV